MFMSITAQVTHVSLSLWPFVDSEETSEREKNTYPKIWENEKTSFYALQLVCNHSQMCDDQITHFNLRQSLIAQQFTLCAPLSLIL